MWIRGRIVEDTRHKVRGEGERFETGAKRAVCATAVESGDQADSFRRLMEWTRLQWSKVRHYAREVIRADGDVGVVDKEKLEPRMRHHLDQRTHLAVGAEAFGTLDEADGMIGKLRLKLLNSRYRGLVERRNTEE